MPEISVIVPIYKTEQYLCQCIDSILAQTLSDFELILVNDGSPDRCGEICDEYAEIDSRVCVIHKENGGVSSARNAGLDIAGGKWVVFVDSDDYVEKQYLQDMIYAQSMISGAFVITDYATFTEENNNTQTTQGQTYIKSIDLDNLSEEEYREFVCQYKLWGPYCKLFSKSIIDRLGLRYDIELKSAEDFWFNVQYLRQVERICYFAVCNYHYRVLWKKLSKQRFIDNSAIKSLHLIANSMIELSNRGELATVHHVIEKMVAEKFYYSRLPMVFAGECIAYKERREMFNNLCWPNGDRKFIELCKSGSSQLQMHPLMRMASRLNCYFGWWIFYRLLSLRNLLR